MRERKFRLARTVLPAVLAVLVYVAVGANRDDVVQAQRLETVTVSICSNGIERKVPTAQTTIGATLMDAGIKVGPLDKVTPATRERPIQGMKITVVHIYDAIETRTEPVACDTVRTFTRLLRPGEVKLTKPGVPGSKQVRYIVRYRDGKAVKRTQIGANLLRKPVSQQLSIGSRGSVTNRGGFFTRSMMRMVATGYDPSPRCCGRGATGRTACGLRAGYGVAAVDPRVIRLGTKLYVEGYGYAIAGDTGSAIRGNRIDLGFDSFSQAKHYGMKTVLVYVLKE